MQPGMLYAFPVLEVAYEELFSLLLVPTSSHLLTQALQLVYNPDPIIGNTSDYSFTFARDEREPQNYFVQLFNDNTGPWHPMFNLQFDDGSLTQNFTNSSNDFPSRWKYSGYVRA
jgi:hypothetical protein